MAAIPASSSLRRIQPKLHAGEAFGLHEIQIRIGEAAKNTQTGLPVRRRLPLGFHNGSGGKGGKDRASGNVHQTKIQPQAVQMQAPFLRRSGTRKRMKAGARMLSWLSKKIDRPDESVAAPELTQMLDRDLAVIFKHSPSCGISWAAEKQVKDSPRAIPRCRFTRSW